MKSWDVIVVGGGIVGMSLALNLRKSGAAVLAIDRSEPGREASHAAAGMLAHCDSGLNPQLQRLALSSAKRYPEFVCELEEESGQRVDFRREGTIALQTAVAASPSPHARPLTAAEVAEMEPGLRSGNARPLYLPEASVDPRALFTALLKAAKRRGVVVVTGIEVLEIEAAGNRASGVRTSRTRFVGPVVVNCAGAWAGGIAPVKLPTKPVKGQMLAKVAPVTYNAQGSPSSPRILRHVVRAEDVYLVPRGDGRILIGSTLEDAGFDKTVAPDAIQKLHGAAAELAPEIARARMLESWAGLRPATPDGLPILGETWIQGYFVASGHYRNGILLAPITAHLLGQLVQGLQPELDISAFAPSRFLGIN